MSVNNTYDYTNDPEWNRVISKGVIDGIYTIVYEDSSELGRYDKHCYDDASDRRFSPELFAEWNVGRDGARRGGREMVEEFGHYVIYSPDGNWVKTELREDYCRPEDEYTLKVGEYEVIDHILECNYILKKRTGCIEGDEDPWKVLTPSPSEGIPPLH